VTLGGADPTTARFEAALADVGTTGYGLILFVSGASELSARAIANAWALCDEHLTGRYDLSIVDVNETPEAATERDVFATPTLVKIRPLPELKLVGDLSDMAKVLAALLISPTSIPATER
jgi:circadian clock protein KaiB